MTSDEGVALQVDDVYVPLRLVERKKQPKPQGDISPEQGSELYKETEITKTFEHDVFLEEVLKQQNTPKSKGRRIAIIGEPGAGKTTVLQQIANWVFCEIPQSVVIWVSLADLQEQKLEEYLLGTWLTAAVRKKGKAEPTQQQKDDLIALFNQKNVWLLLDGLDEMSAASGNPLTEISRQFRESGFISQARILLTCRVNLWDGSINALDDFDIYRTLDFSYPEQVEEFINKWFNKIKIPETRNKLCAALKEPGKERIRDLVKNPLRLTLLCLNWQSRDGKLPDTQAGLYQQFVDDFYKWKKEEFALNSHQRHQLNIKLGELAKTAIDREATRFRLRQDFVTQFLGDADDENSLFKLSINRGWLNQVGIDTNRKPVYAFFHASFQEYFAATAINDWHFFLNHVPKNPSKGTYRIFEPQWKQTILLWLGSKEENLKHQKQQFIDALVNFKDGCGEWDREDVDKGFYGYQAYFLAATGITEFKDCPQADEIVKQIVKWICGYSPNRERWVGFLNPIRAQAQSQLQQIELECTQVIATLEEILQSTIVHDYTRWAAALRLVTIDPDHEKVITALVELLQSKTVDDYSRQVAAEHLGTIGTGNEEAIAALVKVLQSTTVDDYARRHTGYDASNGFFVFPFPVDKSSRRQIAESLQKIGIGNQFAIAALVELLQSPTLDHNAYEEVAETLQKIGIGNKFAIAALVELLQSPTLDHYTRWAAAESLATIDPDNEIAITTLVEQLQLSTNLYLSTTLHNDIRWRAAFSLRKIGIGNEFLIAALVQLLKSTTVDDETRTRAVVSLGEIATGNEIVIAVLVEQLQSTSVRDYTRCCAAESLHKIDPGNEIAIAVLVEQLQSTSVYDYTRYCAAESLQKIDPGNKIAITTLVEQLQSKSILLPTDPDITIRWQVSESLKKIDPGNETAIAALMQLLQSSSVDNDALSRAAESLERIDPGNELVIAALEKVLQSTNVDHFTRRQAAQNLGKIDPGNQLAIAALIELLQSTTLDDNTRIWIAQELGKIDPGNKFAIASLIELLQSTTLDDNNCRQAAESLGTIDPGNEIAIASLIELLQSTTLDDNNRKWVAQSLEKIGTGNEFAIIALVKLLQSTTVYHLTRKLAAKSLSQIIQNYKHLSLAVASLKNYLQFDDNYNVIWKCSQNMAYPDFYQVWHPENCEEVSPNHLDLPQRLQDAIKNDPQLSQKIHLICIDTSKFIEPDNPASKIYTAIVKAGCPKCPDGTPTTMAKLQTYWDLLETDKQVVLVFHSVPINTTGQAIQSKAFLNAISKFEGKICLISDPIPDYNTLKVFTPSQSVDEILEWLSCS